MPRPKGTPKTGGVRKGATHKQTLDVKELARDYTEQAVLALAKIMLKGTTEAAIVAASKEILDRGHGKSAQAVNVSGSLGLAIRKIELVGVRPSDNSQAGDTR